MTLLTLSERLSQNAGQIAGFYDACAVRVGMPHSLARAACVVSGAISELKSNDSLEDSPLGKLLMEFSVASGTSKTYGALTRDVMDIPSVKPVSEIGVVTIAPSPSLLMETRAMVSGLPRAVQNRLSKISENGLLYAVLPTSTTQQSSSLVYSR